MKLSEHLALLDEVDGADLLLVVVDVQRLEKELYDLRDEMYELRRLLAAKDKHINTLTADNETMRRTINNYEVR